MANWTLVDGDWDLVANKRGATRLGFSLLLKFFELECRARKIEPPGRTRIEKVLVAARGKWEKGQGSL